MTTDRNHLRDLASRASDDGYTGNDNDGHLTVSPAVLTELLDALDDAEARIEAVRVVLDEPDTMVGGDVRISVDRVRRALEG